MTVGAFQLPIVVSVFEGKLISWDLLIAPRIFESVFSRLVGKLLGRPYNSLCNATLRGDSFKDRKNQRKDP
ncbi:uncharacterized protein [Physcomitrium patens]|uniref:uncharacterized protein isoform X3 n=1 Tax=Physcomitrium patens TaxID=3218 RepID=UPI003CCCEE7C